MSKAKAISKYMKISPRKARLAAGLIRNLPVGEASTQLSYSNLKAGRMLKKTLDSAVANAENNHDLRREELFVLEAKVDEGPRAKRSKSKSRGGRAPILKKTSHITVVVG